MESGRRDNNVHFVSKNGFWVHTCASGFWVRLRFVRQYETFFFNGIELTMFQLKFTQGYKLCNKECKEMKQTWKKTTQYQNVSQIVKLYA
jgi:hypothetical protein